MHYSYILLSSKSHIFYFGSAKDLKLRLIQHNNFERYLKTGSGKSFAYKRLVAVALEKDFAKGRKGSPKSRYSEANSGGYRK